MITHEAPKEPWWAAIVVARDEHLNCQSVEIIGTTSNRMVVGYFLVCQ